MTHTQGNPITIPLKQADDEACKPGFRQCLAMHATRSGGVWCRRPEGHEGDHRGYRKQWPR